MGAGFISAARRRTTIALTGALMQVVDNASVALSNGVDIPYSQNDFDDHGWETSTTTLTTPSSIGSGQLMRLFSGFDTTGSGCFARHFKSGATFDGSGGGSAPVPTTGSDFQGSIWSAIVPAVAGEAFTTNWSNKSATTKNDGRNWFGVELLPPGTRYTLALLPSTLTLASTDGNKQVNWTHTVDTLGSHSNTTNTNQFVIPSGTTGKVRLTASLRTSNSAAAAGSSLLIFKNGVLYGCADRTDHGTGAFNFNRVVSPIIDVVAGDVLEVKVAVSAGSGWTYPAIGENWICFEEVPATWKYCRVGLTSNKTGLSGDNAISWDIAQSDALGCWSSGDPSKIYVPSGATKARASHCFDGALSGILLSWVVSPSSGITKQSGGGQCTANVNTSVSRGCSLGTWFKVTAGWPLVFHLFGTGTLNANDKSWFQVEFQ